MPFSFCEDGIGVSRRHSVGFLVSSFVFFAEKSDALGINPIMIIKMQRIIFDMRG